MKPHKRKYSQGATFSGILSWIGLGLVIFGVFGVYRENHLVTISIWTITIIVGITLFLCIMGVIIDFNQKVIHFYFSLILFRIHFKKVDIGDFESVDLVFFSENQTMSVVPQSTTVRTKVYKILLTNSEKDEVLIAESTDYSKAISIMNEIAEGLDFKARNRYGDWVKQVKHQRKTAYNKT